MKIAIASILCGVVLVGLTPTNAWGQTGPPSRYQLDDKSSFDRGCFELCACPLLQSRLVGTFDLRHLNDDPLYSHYAVENVSWIAHEPSRSLPITGSGTYQVGGEFALQERMILDLSVDGGPTRRYDSGLITGGGDFPRITIAMRIHSPPVCADSMITIAASPGVLGIDSRASGFPRVSPNPFATRMDVMFALAVEGRVDVAILDLSGRRVRRLARNLSFGPGIHALPWDGLDEDGAMLPAGHYRVRVQAEGRTAERSVVKLR